MSRVIVGMTVSLDGFVEDASGSVAALYPDFEAMHEYPALLESIAQTGAVVMGRRTFAMGDSEWYDSGYEYQVPIFVLTHQPPARPPMTKGTLTFTFVTEGVESAIAQAKAAAGDKDVTVVGGASTIQQILGLGLADELHIDVMPVLLGSGLRLLERLEDADIRLEKIDVLENGPRTSLRFRISQPQRG